MFPGTFPTRRELLRRSGSGLAYLAMAGLAHESARADTVSVQAAANSPLAERPPHFAPRAKRVIMMFMQGGPSHIDTFDYKPQLKGLAERGDDREPSRARGRLMPSPWQFSRHGESGLAISELFPHLAKHADQLCLLHGMHTDNPAHPQATIMMHTGAINFVRPSMGSWIVYGLGTQNRDLPGFVTINPGANPGGAQNYGSAFLPAAFQGTQVAAGNSPIANIRNQRRTTEQQRRHLDLLQAMNQDTAVAAPDHSELDGIIESYELAFRMQAAVPDLLDLTQEPESVRTRYGLDQRPTSEFGTQCLMARRLAEAGVRFIEISHRGWDQHQNLQTALPRNCRAIDQPIAALLDDLATRGLLHDTLLVWTGEFGRTPQEQNNFQGRRHNHQGFTAWMAGGGVRGGLAYGATDPTGLEAVEGKVHVHDLHATILHLLGLDHERLTYRYSGRDFRLTDVHGQVVKSIIA
jgi:hypothetical protein